jgi:hypothetical protein
MQALADTHDTPLGLPWLAPTRRIDQFRRFQRSSAPGSPAVPDQTAVQTVDATHDTPLGLPGARPNDGARRTDQLVPFHRATKNAGVCSPPV